jgi:NTP pyrophosphatase (non-canonical NTP hydrolase)
MKLAIDRIIAERALRHYGREAQLTKTVEELGELIVAISKHQNGLGNPARIIEETADVLSMLAQVILIFLPEKPELMQQVVDGRMEAIARRLDDLRATPKEAP